MLAAMISGYESAFTTTHHVSRWSLTILVSASNNGMVNRPKISRHTARALRRVAGALAVPDHAGIVTRLSSARPYTTSGSPGDPLRRHGQASR
jgi:hypothetical protein